MSYGCYDNVMFHSVPISCIKVWKDLLCLAIFKANTLTFPEKALMLSQPLKAWKPWRDLHSSGPNIRTTLDTSMYVVRVLATFNKHRTWYETFKSQRENKHVCIF